MEKGKRIAGCSGISCLSGLSGFLQSRVPAMMRYPLWTFLLIAILLFLGCDRKKKSLQGANEDPVLVAIGDTALTLSEVELRIPVGLSPDDSVAMFASIVDTWVEDILLAEFGKENIDDMDRIERMTKDYRNRLIAESYRRRMHENNPSKVSEERIRDYYNSHPEEMKLQRPLVKGIYLRLPSKTSNLSDIRQWIFSGKPSGIDNLEKHGLRDALQYSFFEDRWVDWQNVADQIPYRFGDPDAFLESHRNFETAKRGVTYLLHISDVCKTGTPMPQEYATVRIGEILDTRSASDYERSLIDGLYRKAIKEKHMTTPGYDPVNHRLR